MRNRDAENEFKRIQYHARKRNGICVTCGNDLAIEGSNLCPECSFRACERARERRKNMTREEKDKINALNNKKKKERQQNGLCSCGKQRDNEKYKLCKDCRKYYRDYKRKKADPKMWMELGLCRWCGGELLKDINFALNILKKSVNRQRKILGQTE